MIKIFFEVFKNILIIEVKNFVVVVFNKMVINIMVKIKGVIYLVFGKFFKVNLVLNSEVIFVVIIFWGFI